MPDNLQAMATKYVVNDGFIVAGKQGGESVRPSDVQDISILVASGRVRVEAAEGGTMKKSDKPTIKEDKDQ
jgi:hypothetical protein